MCVLILTIYIHSFLICANGLMMAAVSTVSLIPPLQEILPLTYAPAQFPLSPLIVLNPEDLVNYARETEKIIREAALPTSNSDLFSIVISEASAGFIAGIVSKGFLNLVNGSTEYMERDTLVAVGESTAAYFGVRSLVTVLAEILDIPRPIARILGNLVASLFAESTKVATRIETDGSVQTDVDVGRVSESATRVLSSGTVRNKISKVIKTAKSKGLNSIVQDAKNWVKLSIEPENGKKPLITWQEIGADLSKWIVYDLVVPSESEFVAPSDALLSGCIAGTVGHTVKERFPYGKVKDPKWTSVLSRFSKASIEGGILFTAYEGCLQVFATNSIFVSNPVLYNFLESQWPF